MKKLAVLFLLTVLLIPSCALAYLDAVTGATIDESTLIYGRLNTRMATRTGPGTKYEEPGVSGAAGDYVKIISMGYSSVPWVQVETNIGGRLMRVYTGFKRIDGVNQYDVPQEMNLNLAATVVTPTIPTYGPGAHFAKYNFTLGKGKKVVIIDFEGDYAMCDYQPSRDGDCRRLWVPRFVLSY